MGILSVLLIVVGLAVFETISSIDNVIINSEVLSTMKPKARKWFMGWGILFAVFIIRGLLPWFLLWVSDPSVGFIQILKLGVSTSGTSFVISEQASSILLSAGGAFLVVLFLHWFFVESKEFYNIFRLEKSSAHKMFYILSLLLLLAIAAISWNQNSLMVMGAIIGTFVFILIFKIRDLAEKKERLLKTKGKLTDRSKIIYLELIDTAFSIDGVLGAFAFTFSIPFILIGNGLGALIVRNLTIRNLGVVKKYQYLKHGAMYSICFLGIIMYLDSFGVTVPSFISPIATFVIVGYFLLKSSNTNNRI